MIYKFLVLGLLILLGIGASWMLYKYLQNKYPTKPITLMDSTQIISPDLELQFPPSQIVLPNPKKGDQLGITYAFKLFIDGASENENWGSRFDQLKPIIRYLPSVHYHPFENYLEFGVKIQDNKFSQSYQTLKLENLPLQQWLRIVAVFSSTRIKVYLNNKLVASRTLKNPPILENQTMYIGQENNNLKGILGPIIYWSHPLDEELIIKATEELS